MTATYEKSNANLLAGTMLLSTVICAYILANISMILGGRIYFATFPIAVLISIAAAWRTTRANIPRLRKGLGIYATLLSLSLLLSVLTMDFSWDGNMYHQEIIALLMNGWNPFSTAELTSDYSLWTNHYAKALETVSATIAIVLNNIEAGKAVNYLLLFSTALLALYCVQWKFRSLKPWKQFAIAIAIVANPVVVSQVLTYYIDFAKYIYLLWTLFLIYRITQSKSRYNSALLVGVIILAIGTKFNIFFEEGVWLMLAIVWLWITKQRSASKTITIIGFVGLILGVACAYHPYITNIQLAGNPLYPLLGENSVDIMSYNTPAELNGNRFTNFLRAIFAIELPRNDARIGGFGPLAGIVLPISFFIMYRLRKMVNPASLFAFICIFLSCFIFEQAWWARYTAQLWLLPSIALFLGLQFKRSKLAAKILLACMLINAPICMARSIVSVGVIHQFRDAVFTPLANDTIILVNNQVQFEMRFNDHNIHLIKADSIPDDFKGDVVYYYGRSNNLDLDFYPMMVLNPEQAQKVRERMNNNFLNYEIYIYDSIE